jgi:hypothetical protein
LVAAGQYARPLGPGLGPMYGAPSPKSLLQNKSPRERKSTGTGEDSIRKGEDSIERPRFLGVLVSWWGVARSSFCDVCDLLAIGIECTGAPGNGAAGCDDHICQTAACMRHPRGH